MTPRMTVGQIGQRAEAFAFLRFLVILSLVYRQLDFQLSNQYSGWAFSLLVLRDIGLIQRGDFAIRT